MRMGMPLVLLSDNGTEFCNELNDILNELLELLGIKTHNTIFTHK